MNRYKYAFSGAAALIAGTAFLPISLAGGTGADERAASLPTAIHRPLTPVPNRSSRAVHCRPKRIVSLAPSNTELLFALGAEQELAADSTFCDYPPAAKGKPKVGTFQSVNFEKLCALQPDMVLLVSGQEALSEFIKHHGFRTAILRNDSLADVANNVQLIGQVTGHQDSATAIAASYRRLLSELKQLTGAAEYKPRTFCLVWAQPLLTVGKRSYLNDAITICGGNNISGSLDATYPKYSPERLLLDQPDVIIVTHQQKDQSFLKSPPWSSLKAVRNNKIHIVSSEVEDRLDRPTLRILDGLYWLAGSLHPELKEKLEHWHERINSLATLKAGK